jgi:hypothetical protein
MQQIPSKYFPNTVNIRDLQGKKHEERKGKEVVEFYFSGDNQSHQFAASVTKTILSTLHPLHLWTCHPNFISAAY